MSASMCYSVSSNIKALIRCLYRFFPRQCVVYTDVSRVNALLIQIFPASMRCLYRCFPRQCVVYTDFSRVNALFIQIFLASMCCLYRFFPRHCVVYTDFSRVNDKLQKRVKFSIFFHQDTLFFRRISQRLKLYSLA